MGIILPLVHFTAGRARAQGAQRPVSPNTKESVVQHLPALGISIVVGASVFGLLLWKLRSRCIP
jgi:2-keto-3-deoxy-6-phosphogluconate aldolase